MAQREGDSTTSQSLVDGLGQMSEILQRGEACLREQLKGAKVLDSKISELRAENARLRNELSQGASVVRVSLGFGAELSAEARAAYVTSSTLA